MSLNTKSRREQLRDRLERIRWLSLEVRILQHEAAAAVSWPDDLELKPETVQRIDLYLGALDQRVQDLEADLEQRKAFIDSLSDPARELLVLRYLEGMTWDQVAHAAGMSAQHVQRLCNAALEAAVYPGQ